MVVMNFSVSERIELYFSFYVTAQYSPLCIMKYSTRKLSNPLCNYLKTFRGPAEELHVACNRLIVRIVETHRMYLSMNNGNHCTTKILHQFLLVAARMAFSCRLPYSSTVSRLLGEVFRCDKTFRRILIGGYYNPIDCYDLAGIDSLFNTQEESLEAARYFLYHATKTKKHFICNRIAKRMQDVPMQEEYYGHPAAFAIATDNSRMFKLLVEYGTNLHDDTELLNVEDLLSMTEVLPYLCTKETSQCREIFFRAQPVMKGKQFPSLQTLSKWAIRKYLHEYFQLPFGIEDLHLPKCMKKYINLDTD